MLGGSVPCRERCPTATGMICGMVLPGSISILNSRAAGDGRPQLPDVSFRK